MTRVSVVIPARDEEAAIGGTVAAVSAQGIADVELEIIVVDDGSTDGTAAAAAAAAARVVRTGSVEGNPAAARNRGAAVATGDPIIFLDADCRPTTGWLAKLLSAHAAGEGVVGGSLDLPSDLPMTARLDYYCGWYHVHSRRRPGPVPNHPPGNLSVRRDVFRDTSGFDETPAVAYAHEELLWQGEVRDRGLRIYFEPQAIVLHRNRTGVANLLRRSYRWGYSSIESKARTGAARHAWAYRYPAVLVAASVPLAVPVTAYTVYCWMRARVWEPLWLGPGILLARLAYAFGMMVGGVRFLAAPARARASRPRWA